MRSSSRSVGAGICTITNDDQPATLTLVKTVTNDNGGTAAPTAWTLTRRRPDADLGSHRQPGRHRRRRSTPAPTRCPSPAARPATPPAPGPATGGTLDRRVARPAHRASTSPARSPTTTSRPTLTLVKTVTNDNGGTAAPTAWTLTRRRPDADHRAPPARRRSPTAPVDAGTYDAVRVRRPGRLHRRRLWSCTGGTVDRIDRRWSPPGGDVTCTINNDDQPATLTLVKTVTNDNGGTAVPTDWTLTAAGPDRRSPAPPAPPRSPHAAGRRRHLRPVRVRRPGRLHRRRLDLHRRHDHRHRPSRCRRRRRHLHDQQQRPAGAR